MYEAMQWWLNAVKQKTIGIQNHKIYILSDWAAIGTVHAFIS